MSWQLATNRPDVISLEQPFLFFNLYLIENFSEIRGLIRLKIDLFSKLEHKTVCC